MDLRTHLPELQAVVFPDIQPDVVKQMENFIQARAGFLRVAAQRKAVAQAFDLRDFVRRSLIHGHTGRYLNDELFRAERVGKARQNQFRREIDIGGFPFRQVREIEHV